MFRSFLSRSLLGSGLTLLRGTLILVLVLTDLTELTSSLVLVTRSLLRDTDKSLLTELSGSLLLEAMLLSLLLDTSILLLGALALMFV